MRLSNILRIAWPWDTCWLLTQKGFQQKLWIRMSFQYQWLAPAVSVVNDSVSSIDISGSQVLQACCLYVLLMWSSMNWISLHQRMSSNRSLFSRLWAHCGYHTYRIHDFLQLLGFQTNLPQGMAHYSLTVNLLHLSWKNNPFHFKKELFDNNTQMQSSIRWKLRIPDDSKRIGSLWENTCLFRAAFSITL